MRQTGHVDDDTFISHKQFKSIETIINSELKKLSTWLRLNNLSLNSVKTELIFFHSKYHSLKYEGISIKSYILWTILDILVCTLTNT